MIFDNNYPIMMESYLDNMVDNCKKLPQTYKTNDRDIIDQKYFELCEETSKFVVDEFKKCSDGKHELYYFSSAIITTCYNLLLKKGDKVDAELYFLFNSALRKYRDVIYCLEQEDYESGLILYKSLFETVVIAEFLSIHEECKKPYIDYSMYKLMKIIPDVDGKKLSAHIEEIESHYKECLDCEYGWAKSVFGKNDIVLNDLFTHIVSETNTQFIDYTIKIMDCIVNKNLSKFCISEILGKNTIKDLLLKNIEVYFLKLFIVCFNDMFSDISEENYFLSNIFLVIFEKSFDFFNFKLDIRDPSKIMGKGVSLHNKTVTA
jgi:hypothetical protein